MAARYQVPAIKRAFEIIELLAKQDGGASISEIHRALHLPLSSAAMIVYTLADLGYLERDQDGTRYRLGVKMFGIARQAPERVNLVALCHGQLEEVARKSGLTGHLAVLRGGESMYIDRAQGASLVQVSSYVGMRWPAHVSAVGKALLAFLPQSELHEVLNHVKLKKLTPYTVTSCRVLEKELQLVRRLGYAWELNEGELGLGCVAAPVSGSHHEVVAAISLSGTTHHVTRNKIPALGTLVKQYSQQMSIRLGASSDSP